MSIVSWIASQSMQMLGSGVQELGRYIEPQNKKTHTQVEKSTISDEYIPMQLESHSVKIDHLRQQLGHLKQRQNVLQEAFQRASKDYMFKGLGSLGGSIGFVALALGCLCTFPWQVFGGFLLLVSRYVVPVGFAYEQELYRVKEDLQARYFGVKGQIRWVENVLAQLEGIERVQGSAFAGVTSPKPQCLSPAAVLNPYAPSSSFYVAAQTGRLVETVLPKVYSPYPVAVQPHWFVRLKNFVVEKNDEMRASLRLAGIHLRDKLHVVSSTVEPRSSEAAQERVQQENKKLGLRRWLPFYTVSKRELKDDIGKLV